MSRRFTMDSRCPVCDEDGWEDAQSLNAHIEAHEHDDDDDEQEDDE